MKRIGILANCAKPHARGVLERLSRKAADLGLTLCATAETAEFLPDASVVEEDRLGEEIDVLLALGGDGSMLRAVRALGGSDTPVMGVNLGSLGFMTSVPEDQLEGALDVLVSGTFTVSTRAVAECHHIQGDRTTGVYRGLNDVVVGWGASSRVVTLNLSIDEQEVTEYVCDGLIISTPTGSTGHSLSAGGPILHPETPAFVISVLCPHALSHRPLVVPDRCAIAVEVTAAPKPLLLSVDGQEVAKVESGDRLTVCRSPASVRFIHPPDHSYYSVLRQKLGWRGSHLVREPR